MAQVSYADAPQSAGSGRPEATRHVPDEVSEMSGPLLLRDGRVVQVRPIQPNDSERLLTFHARLSPESIEYRYFGPVPVLTPAHVEHLTHVDYAQRMALVATTGQGANERIIAVVRYEGIDARTAEVAFVVEDPWQGHGIATQLLYRLARYARRWDFTTFVAEIMSSNQRMREVIRHAGFPFTTTYQDGCVEMRMDITAAPSGPYVSPSGGPSK